jgi:hypothetical protein
LKRASTNATAVHQRRHSSHRYDVLEAAVIAALRFIFA